MRSDDAEAYYRDRDPLERELDDDYETDERRPLPEIEAASTRD